MGIVDIARAKGKSYFETEISQHHASILIILRAQDVLIVVNFLGSQL